jgi:hypothetical protein
MGSLLKLPAPALPLVCPAKEFVVLVLLAGFGLQRGARRWNGAGSCGRV